MPGFSDTELARVVLQSGLATPEQLDDARRLVEQMKTLGVERDILGALVDRKVIDQAAADRLRAQVSAGGPPPPSSAEATEGQSVALEVLEAEVVVEEELKVAPDYRPGVSAAPETSPVTAPCYNHPDKQAVAFCSHCNRPVCVHCVIRTDKGAFCSEACAVGSTSAAEAELTAAGRTREQAVKLGGYARWVAVVAVLLGVVWVVKWLVDDYRVSFALQRAKNKGDTSREGMAALKTAVSLRPKRADLRVRLGKAYVAAGQAGLAIRQLEAAIRHDPKCAEAFLAITDAYVAKGMNTEAARALLKLRKIGAADSKSERRLGVILRDNLDDPSAAVEAFRCALKVGSESRELHYEAGKASFAEGDLAGAKVELLKAVAPFDPARERGASRERGFLEDTEKMGQAYSILIDIVEKEGDVAALDALLAQAQAGAPKSALIVTRRAELLMGQGRRKEALDALAASRKALSHNPEYLELLARLQREAGAQKEALATMRILCNVAPDRPGAVEGLATLEAAVGDPARAMKFLQSLSAERRASDDLFGVWQDLVRNQLSRGRVTSAEKMLRSLGPRAERDPRFASVWCEVLHRLGRDAEALERAELALRRDPDNPAPHLVVGSVLRSLGRTREALEKARTAARLGAGGLADLEMAMLSWQGGLKGEAARSLAKALADPNLSEKKKQEVRAYLARMRESEAMPAYLSPVMKLLQSRLRTIGTDSGGFVPRARLATHGARRLYGMLSGSVGVDPQPTELDSIREMCAGKRGRIDAKALLMLRTESDKMVRDAERALKAMYPRASSDVRDAAAEYGRRLHRSGDEGSKLAAAAAGHLRVLRAALRHHPRAAEMAPALDTAVRRMAARKALAPGALQEAICADLASVEVVAAAIEVGPGSFLYQTAVAGVLSGIVTADAEATDPLSQFAAGRIALFKMLRIFTAQAREMGSISEVGGGAKGEVQ